MIVAIRIFSQILIEVTEIGIPEKQMKLPAGSGAQFDVGVRLVLHCHVLCLHVVCIVCCAG